MKNGIGIIRKIDELGRIVVPIEIRRAFDINSQDSVEIHTTDEGILLKKHTDCCIFCGSNTNIVVFKDKKVCSDCASGVNAAKN